MCPIIAVGDPSGLNAWWYIYDGTIDTSRPFRTRGDNGKRKWGLSPFSAQRQLAGVARKATGPGRRAARNAFTLIEVLVVVALIALLVGLLLPSLSKAREQSRRVVCGSNMAQIAKGIHTYTADFKGHVPNSWKDENASLTWTIYRQVPRHYVGYLHLGLLYKGRQIREPRVFFCPSNIEFPHTYPEGWFEYVSPNGLEHMAVGYMYAIAGQIGMYRKGQRISPKIDELLKPREALVSCMFLANVDKLQRRGLWPHKGGINAGYSDASATFKKVDSSIAFQAAKISVQPISQRDYFTYCIWKLLDGDRKWIQAFPQRPIMN